MPVASSPGLKPGHKPKAARRTPGRDCRHSSATTSARVPSIGPRRAACSGGCSEEKVLIVRSSSSHDPPGNLLSTTDVGSGLPLGIGPSVGGRGDSRSMTALQQSALVARVGSGLTRKSAAHLGGWLHRYWWAFLAAGVFLTGT